MNILKRIKKFEPVESFFIMELLALCAFSLGGINLIFYYAGFVVVLFGFLMCVDKFKKNEFKSLLYVGLPLILIAIFVSFGNLHKDENVALKIGSFLAIVSFFALGLFSRRMKSLKIENVLLCIGFGLALLTLITTIYTWVQYGFFYSLIYKDVPYYYYNGQTYNVTKETGWLFGFKFYETSINYSGLFGVILSSGLTGLFFINPKRELKKFIITLFIGLIGLLSLLTGPNVNGLLILIPIAIFSLILNFLYSDKIQEKTKKLIRKILYIAFIVLVAILFLFFILAFLNASGLEGLQGYSNFIANNYFLNKLFNNGKIMEHINYILNRSVLEYNIFGFMKGAAYYQTEQVIYIGSNFFEFEIIKEGGIFALFVLIIFILTAIGSLSRYSKKSKDNPFIKIIIISSLLGLFLYSTFFYDSFPIIHSEEEFFSFFRSLPVLIALFLVGYSFYPDLKENEVPAFEIEDETTNMDAPINQEIIDNDYTFVIDETEESEHETKK